MSKKVKAVPQAEPSDNSDTSESEDEILEEEDDLKVRAYIYTRCDCRSCNIL